LRPLRHRFLIAVAVLLPTLLAASAPAGARPAFGVQGISGDSAPALQRDMTAVKGLHSSLVRVQAWWAALQPTSADAYDAEQLARLDRIVDAAAGQGQKVVLFGDGTPCWASSAPSKVLASCTPRNGAQAGRYPPTDPAAFARFSAFLVQRYGAKLAAYQVWNEPDQRSEDYWAGPDKVTRYVAMAKVVYPAVKAVAPSLPVLAGSFVGGNGAWLKALYRAGIKGSYDGLAVQFYDLPLLALRTTRAVQRAHGDTKPMWLTEFGYSSCYRKGGAAVLHEHYCLTRAGQAQAVTDLLGAIRSTPWIKAAIMYSLRDESSAYAFGALDGSGRRKPLARSLSRATTSATARLRPTLRLKLRHGRVYMIGTASVTDLYEAKVSQGGSPRYLITVRTDRFGHFAVSLPAALGTSGLAVALRSTWSGSAARATR
jgi:polysaccharide biosynthesis protein PslG